MYKLYLVDDEPYVIEGIRKCIAWEKHGICIAGSANNGLTALQEILALQPDVVIIDIKMPSMDGISVINKVKEKLPETAFIIISGYDDFQYAKQAIQARVVDYLVKPAAAEEIFDAVTRALAQMKTQEQVVDYRSPDYRNIIENMFSKPTTDIRSDGYYYVAIPETSELSTIRRREPELDIPVSGEMVHCMFMELLDHHLVIIYAVRTLNKQEIQTVIGGIRENLEIFFTDESDMLRIGLSRPGRLQNLKAGYGEAKEALAYGQWISADCSLYDMISYGEVDVEHLPLWEKLKRAVRDGDGAAAAVLFKAQFEDFFRCHISPRALKEFCLKAYVLIRDPELAFYQIDPILEINSMRSIADSNAYLISLYRNYFERLHARPGGTPRSHFVGQVLDYIHRHYQEPITLYDVAEYMHKSNGYISSRFKKEFGGSFSSYVNDYRLLQSRRLLISSNMKVKEIALAVGFSDEQYFSNVFKKEFGMTPGNYRKIYRS